jgi:hypothetical protein
MVAVVTLFICLVSDPGLKTPQSAERGQSSEKDCVSKQVNVVLNAFPVGNQASQNSRKRILRIGIWLATRCICNHFFGLECKRA